MVIIHAGRRVSPSRSLATNSRATMPQKAKISAISFALAFGLGVMGDLAQCAWIQLPAWGIPLFAAFHYVAILLAAGGFGLEIGLGAAVLIAVFHTIAKMTACGEPISQQGEVLSFIVVGLLAGFLVKGRRERFGRVSHSPDTASDGRVPVGFVRAVRAPLSAIESAGYLLEDSVLTEANHREVAAIILRECHRLDVLVKLLEFGHARLPAYREVNLSSVLDEIVRCGAPLAEAACITLRKAEDAELRAICDPELLEQVSLNLLANAIHVTEHGDEIILSARIDKNNAVIEISNPRGGVLGQLGTTTMTSTPESARHASSHDVNTPRGGGQ